MKVLEFLKHAFVSYCAKAGQYGMARMTGDCTIPYTR